MINNQYDELIVGDSYLSYLMGILYQRKGKSVLVVEDDQFNFSGRLLTVLSQLEFNYLNLLIKRFDILKDARLGDFCTPSKTVYNISNRHLYLGQDIKTNMIELCRKFPEVFNLQDDVYQMEEDQEQMLAQLQDIFDKSFKFLSFHNLSESKLTESLSKIMNKFVDSLTSALKSQDEKIKDLARNLLYIFQIESQTTFSNKFNKLQISTLIMSMIYPRYNINSEELKQSFMNSFHKSGGHNKKTRIARWQDDEKEMQKVLLASFEGLINFKRLTLMSKIADSAPFYLEDHKRAYSNIIVDVTYPEEHFESYDQLTYLVSEAAQVGSDFPFIYLEFKSSSRVCAHFIYPLRVGSKPQLYFDTSIEKSFTVLKRLFPALEKEKFVFSSQVSVGSNIWVEDFVRKRSSAHVLTTKSTQMQEQVRYLESNEVVKNLDYWGPQKASPLGLFSYLVETNNHVL